MHILISFTVELKRKEVWRIWSAWKADAMALQSTAMHLQVFAAADRSARRGASRQPCCIHM